MPRIYSDHGPWCPLCGDPSPSRNQPCDLCAYEARASALPIPAPLAPKPVTVAIQRINPALLSPAYRAQAYPIDPATLASQHEPGRMGGWLSVCHIS